VHISLIKTISLEKDTVEPVIEEVFKEENFVEEKLSFNKE